MIDLHKRLALGTVQFGLNYGISNNTGKTKESEVAKILEAAWEKGIDTIDTARGYGDSESILGKQLKHPFRIVTKFSSGADTSEKIEESLLASLKALHTKSVYALIAHDADLLIRSAELWKTLIEMKEKKIAEKIGYSLYTPGQLQRLIELDIVPDIVQFPYNFLDQRFKPFFKRLKTIGTEIHVRSVFLQGLFFMKPEQLPAWFDLVKPILKKLQLALPGKNELAGWLLQFVLKEENIDKIVLGVNTAQQLRANLSALVNHNSVSIDAADNIPEEIFMPNLWPKASNKV